MLNWIIHLVANDVECDICKKSTKTFKDGLINAHTHGMNKYNHPEFQIVLGITAETICYTLNRLSSEVSEGKTFKDGDVIEGYFENNLNIRLKEVSFEGEKLLRVIFPDINFKYPGEKGCEYPYNLQFEDESGIYLSMEN